MKYHERKAKEFLKSIGWGCRKIKPVQSKNTVGMPDFNCFDNGVVEVKKESKSRKDITIQGNQLDRIRELNLEGKDTFLLCLRRNKEFELYKIEYINLKQSDLS